MSPFHAGEIEVQERMGVREGAERVRRIISSRIPPAERGGEWASDGVGVV